MFTKADERSVGGCVGEGKRRRRGARNVDEEEWKKRGTAWNPSLGKASCTHQARNEASTRVHLGTRCTLSRRGVGRKAGRTTPGVKGAENGARGE